MIQVFEKSPAQGCLAGSDLAGDLHEPLSLGNGVNEVGERFFMTFAQEKIGGIRNKLERVFPQAEKKFIHFQFNLSLWDVLRSKSSQSLSTICWIFSKSSSVKCLKRPWIFK